jgi:hypothetical protein
MRVRCPRSRKGVDTIDTNTIIAITVGGIGVLVGLIGLAVAVSARLGQGHLRREVESMLQESVQTASATWVRDRELQTRLKALDTGLGIMGRLTEAVQLVMRAKSGAVTNDDALKAVSTAGRAAANLHKEARSRFKPDEAAAIATAKDLAHEALFHVRSSLETVAEPADLSEKCRLTLGRLLIELDVCQQVFRDRSLKLLAERTLSSDDRPDDATAA